MVEIAKWEANMLARSHPDENSRGPKKAFKPGVLSAINDLFDHVLATNQKQTAVLRDHAEHFKLLNDRHDASVTTIEALQQRIVVLEQQARDLINHSIRTKTVVRDADGKLIGIKSGGEL